MKIRCAICNKPVDRWSHWQDDVRLMDRIEVFCHGDTDSMVIPLQFLAELSPQERRQFETTEGVAFTTPRISEK